MVCPTFISLQQFGLIPLEIKTFKYYRTEQRRTRRVVYIKAIVDTKTPLCVEQRWLFVSFIGGLYTGHISHKLLGSCMQNLPFILCRQHLCDIAF